MTRRILLIGGDGAYRPLDLGGPAGAGAGGGAVGAEPAGAGPRGRDGAGGGPHEPASLRAALEAARPDVLVDMIPFTVAEAEATVGALKEHGRAVRVVAVSSADVLCGLLAAQRADRGRARDGAADRGVSAARGRGGAGRGVRQAGGGAGLCGGRAGRGGAAAAGGLWLARPGTGPALRGRDAGGGGGGRAASPGRAVALRAGAVRERGLGGGSGGAAGARGGSGRGTWPSRCRPRRRNGWGGSPKVWAGGGGSWNATTPRRRGSGRSSRSSCRMRGSGRSWGIGSGTTRWRGCGRICGGYREARG
jgi:hypothetical protein